MTEDNELKDEAGNPVLDKNIREHIRNTERELKESRERAKAAELKAVYLELGVGDDGVSKLFKDTYSGESTVEAVRTAASQYGDAILKTSQPSTEELERLAALEAQRRINGATDNNGGNRDANDILTATLVRLQEASQKGDLVAFDAIMASPEVQALRGQPISIV